MSRLVVVSNRVAIPGETRAGGLAMALRSALGEHGGVIEQARGIDRLEEAFVLDGDQHRALRQLAIQHHRDAEQLFHAPLVPCAPAPDHAAQPRRTHQHRHHRCDHQQHRATIEQHVESKTA